MWGIKVTSQVSKHLLLLFWSDDLIVGNNYYLIICNNKRLYLPLVSWGPYLVYHWGHTLCLECRS